LFVIPEGDLLLFVVPEGNLRLPLQLLFLFRNPAAPSSLAEQFASSSRPVQPKDTKGSDIATALRPFQPRLPNR